MTTKRTSTIDQRRVANISRAGKAVKKKRKRVQETPRRRISDAQSFTLARASHRGTTAEPSRAGPSRAHLAGCATPRPRVAAPGSRRPRPTGEAMPRHRCSTYATGTTVGRGCTPVAASRKPFARCDPVRESDRRPWATPSSSFEFARTSRRRRPARRSCPPCRASRRDGARTSEAILLLGEGAEGRASLMRRRGRRGTTAGATGSCRRPDGRLIGGCRRRRARHPESPGLRGPRQQAGLGGGSPSTASAPSPTSAGAASRPR